MAQPVLKSTQFFHDFSNSGCVLLKHGVYFIRSGIKKHGAALEGIIILSVCVQFLYLGKQSLVV
jgi:hypothetical protein